MRTYLATSHRVRRGGIEIEGTWAGVQWVALGFLALLPIAARSPAGLFAVTIAALVVYVFPARRRVWIDPGRGLLRIEHAGFFREPWTREIPLADVDRWVLQAAGRRGGQPMFAAYARTRGKEGERVYLVSQVGERATAQLDEALAGTLGGASRN